MIDFDLLKGAYTNDGIPIKRVLINNSIVIKDFDDQGEEPPPTSLNYRLGVFTTTEEIKEWRKRLGIDPGTQMYKTTGDVAVNSPGDGDRVIALKNAFMSNPSSYRWDGDNSGQWNMNSLGFHMQCAAFWHMVNAYPNFSVASAESDAVRTELLWHVNNTDITDWYPAAWTYEIDCFNLSFFLRLYFAYEYIRFTLTIPERQQIEAWLSGHAHLYKRMLHDMLDGIFPNRLTGDYTSTGYPATNCSVDNPEITHRNADGSNGDTIVNLPRYYNNRKGAFAQLIGIIGAGLNDVELIHHAKVYFKEWILFSVYPSGETGENERNGDYGVPQQGSKFYGLLNVGAYAYVAEALARKGDFELYQYSTSDGRCGTQGGPKSFRLVVDTHVNESTGILNRYGRVNFSATVQSFSGSTITITSSSPLNEPRTGLKILGGTSGATARVINQNATNRTLTVSEISGNFINGESLTYVWNDPGMLLRDEVTVGTIQKSYNWSFYAPIINKYYNSDSIKSYYMKTYPGGQYYPSYNTGWASGVPGSIYFGPYTETPGVMLCFAQMEHIDVYNAVPYAIP